VDIRPRGIVGRVVSGNRKILPLEEREKEKRAPSRASEKGSTVSGITSTAASRRPVVISNDNAAIEREATESLLNDMKGLAIGYHAASRFRTFDAAKAFKALPNTQKDSPWVLSQLAKTYYESGDFRNSEEYFVRLLKAQPSRVEDMEVYSTVLWHLKKESALSFLCQVLRDQAFDAPQTWVAVGNAFSLAREHDQAISAFRRATQLDDSLAYAWTLMGHEYIANEAYDSAINSFRKSVAVEPLGYAGWYGLGKSYERMQKLEDAERHYRIAMTLNPTNSTLLVCVGVVLERLQNRHAALAHYSKALELTPHSSLARFKKARVLMHLKQYDMALRDLEVLKSQASDEANVWFLLGKCYKGMGNRSGALRALTTALNLDVKVSDRNALKRKPQRKNYDADDGLPRLLLSSKRR
jgi:anaphase-promoting complex subunit 3